MDDFINLEHKKIKILYHSDNSLVNPDKLLKEVEAIKKRLGKHLKLNSDDQVIEIELYTNRQEWIDHHTYSYGGDLPSWIQGDSGRIIRITLDEEKIQTFDELLLIVEHEAVHHFLRKYTNCSIPAWLDEGLALYMTQELPDRYSDSLKGGLSNEGCIPFELLEKPFTDFDKKLKTLCYAQSYSMVEYIIDAHSWNLIQDMLAALKRKESLDSVLQPYGLNSYLLEKEWKQKINGLQS